MQEDNRSLLIRAQDILGALEDLTGDMRNEEIAQRDEVYRLTMLLANKANEVDQLKREGAHTVREELERLKAELASEKLRHAESIRAARAENDKLREAKNEAFRRLTNQNILLEKIRGLQEANLQLLRERDEAQLERDRLIGETPSEQGSWLIYDKEDNDFGGINCWSSVLTEVMPFKAEGEAWEKIDQFTQSAQQAMRVVTLAEAEVLSRNMKQGDK